MLIDDFISSYLRDSDRNVLILIAKAMYALACSMELADEEPRAVAVKDVVLIIVARRVPIGCCVALIMVV